MTEVNAQKQMEYELNRLGRLVEEQKTLMRRQDERHLAEMQRGGESIARTVSIGPTAVWRRKPH